MVGGAFTAENIMKSERCSLELIAGIPLQFMTILILRMRISIILIQRWNCETFPKPDFIPDFS